MEPSPSPPQQQSVSLTSSPSLPPIYHFKILVPSAAAGRIIGKGGTTIAQLQKDAGARVKMSKASEFYPGTTERVCLISGPIEGILKINDFFMENFSSTSIKILVPNSTAGMIIGRSGSYIKRIKEESGAYVQISQKCTDLSLPERCVTIVGELENIRKACAMILTKIVEDAGNCQHRDIRTTTTTTSSSSTNCNNSIVTTSPSIISSNFIPNSASPNSLSTSPNPISSANNNITTSSSSGSGSSCSDINSAQIIESIKLVLRVSGYGEDAVSEVTSAMSTLASYGVLGVGLGIL